MDFWIFFWDFRIFLNFFLFFGFYGFITKLLRLLQKVTKVTTGNQKWAKTAYKAFLCPKGKKNIGQRPKPCVGAISRPEYMLIGASGW